MSAMRATALPARSTRRAAALRRAEAIVVATIAAVILACAPSTPAHAAAKPSAAAKAKAAKAAASPLKKSIWGPVTIDGVSQFPRYAKLGAGIFMYQLYWDQVAATRPANAKDPRDPAYSWPAELDQALTEAAKYKMRVFVRVTASPKWANGGKRSNFIPDDPADLASFMAAASKRYVNVKYWDVWEEATRAEAFSPLVAETRGKSLTPAQAAAPRAYAKMLDQSYAALKAAGPSDIVVGGNSFVTGDISPRNFIKNLRLPNGKPPRMDMYAHNPFSGRKPDLAKKPLGNGFADFSDLDTLGDWIDDNLTRTKGRQIPIFVTEFTLPTDHANYLFNFWVSRKTQADWLTAALRITRKTPRIASTAWYYFQDQAPNGEGSEVNFGLIDAAGNEKPAFAAFARG